MSWIPIIAGVILAGGGVAFVVHFRKPLVHDAEQHAKGKKAAITSAPMEIAPIRREPRFRT